MGLLALMLLQKSRRAARTSHAGDLVLLADQDRSAWDRDQIREGIELVQRALRARGAGPYAIQAAIAAVHADAAAPDATDWAEIVALYDVLLRMDASPVIELNRAVAPAMRDGPATGLALVDAILARGDLADYHLAHAAQADFRRRLGQTAPAREAYARAISLARQGPERRFLERSPTVNARPTGNRSGRAALHRRGGAAAGRHRHDRARAQRPGGGDRRTVRRDQGAPRGLLPGRGAT